LLRKRGRAQHDWQLTRAMPPAPSSPAVYLLDVDNTLLDNDRVIADLMRHLNETVGHDLQQDYWTLFNQRRADLGYADYLGALQAYRTLHPRDLNVLRVSSFLINYTFANRLFPDSLDVIDRLKTWGPVVVLTDGDVVFQPRKIERSGLFEAVGGNVLIYVHKELEMEDVSRRFPAERYVFVDDKLRLLTAFKAAWGSRVTTVFPRQGHYAHDPEIVRRYPSADITVDRIGDLLGVDLDPEALRLRAEAAGTQETGEGP
jgi:FMN phosphatase YigB (HAD superfamily)